MTVKQFLKIFRNPAITLEVIDESDELIAKTYADGKDVLNDEISNREVRLVKIDSMTKATVTVKNIEDVDPDPEPDTTPTDPADPADPTGTP